MPEMTHTMAELIGEAASLHQFQRTGYAPTSVNVVLNQDTLVVTLHGALTPAERAVATSSAGAAQVQEFHRNLFANSSLGLREEIKRITGVPVSEVAAEVKHKTGAVVHAFTEGTMVQIFLLASQLTPEQWSAKAAENLP